MNAGVATAAKWLDRVEPGWAERVVPADIRMGSLQMCILGQVFSGKTYAGETGYDVGMRRLHYTSDRNEQLAMHVGRTFAADSVMPDWLYEIGQRVAEKQFPDVAIEPPVPVEEPEGELVGV